MGCASKSWPRARRESIRGDVRPGLQLDQMLSHGFKDLVHDGWPANTVSAQLLSEVSWSNTVSAQSLSEVSLSNGYLEDEEVATPNHVQPFETCQVNHVKPFET